MNQNLQISHLKTLIAINEEGSFSAASERVGRTQSAVTHQMQNLEQIIGTPLFAMNGRNRELTNAGLTLLRHAYEIIALCNQAVSAAEKNFNIGTIRVGTPLEIAEDLWPQVLRVFNEAWPNTRVILHVERSPLLMQLLESGELDLAISTRRLGAHKGKPLTSLAVNWIAAADWEYIPREPLPLILTDEPSMFRRMALSALDISGLPYYEKFVSSSMLGVRSAVIAGLGVTARTISGFPPEIQLLDSKIGLPPLPDISYYVHQSDQRMTKECEALLEIILQYIC
ncbi:LysR substrate-binding domain-containing protein [Marinomonas polaris]|uniref:Transcriptional regulator, LysR family n=1 Tax=Marinomonas sp. (strain MWYL1) TaxID=400668 RepID=A6W298_MARMS